MRRRASRSRALIRRAKRLGLAFGFDGRGRRVRRPQGKGAHDHLHFVLAAGRSRALAVNLQMGVDLSIVQIYCSNEYHWRTQSMRSLNPDHLRALAGGRGAGQLHARGQAAEPGAADHQPADPRARDAARRASGRSDGQARLRHRRRPRADRARPAHRRGDRAAAGGHAAPPRRLARPGAHRLQHHGADLSPAAGACPPAQGASQHRAGGDDRHHHRRGRAHAAETRSISASSACPSTSACSSSCR